MVGHCFDGHYIADRAAAGIRGVAMMTGHELMVIRSLAIVWLAFLLVLWLAR